MPLDTVQAPLRSSTAETTTGIETRAVDAFLACVARTGWTKTTFDDIAREAGCSRATLYRYYSGKAALALAALGAEQDRVTRLLIDATDEASTLEDALVAVVRTSAQVLTGHGALGFLLAFEPEVILPQLTFASGDRLLVQSAHVVAPAIAPYLPDGVDALRAGEWIARSVFVYLLRPDTPFDMTTTQGASALVRSFVAPALAGAPNHPEGE